MREEKSFNLQELATITNCKLVGNPTHLIRNVADLENASSEDASFLANPRYLQAMKDSKAGVIFIDSQAPLVDGKNYLVSEQPSRAFQQLVDTLFPQRVHPSGFTGIHPTAVIHDTAQIADGVTIGPQAVIDEGVVIGAHTFIGAGSYIGACTQIGQNCLIHPRVVVREDCWIGNRVILQPGCVIGSCGFGYLTDKQGRHVKLNQVGNVRIEDDVEIGANATIDRARFKSTVIGQGSKIDNLVQIGHGVSIGPYNIIVAQSGIAGSTTTGKYVVLAGQVAVAGHIHLADGVTVAGKSGITKSLPAGKYGGIPAVPIADYNRNQVFLRKIETFVNQLKGVEARLQKLEEVI
ncbi:UDP-3-O-[3-hydroxymyristoyl] glucosamine N-acyltransferase [Candidatus Protochlamydia naegleriophila]|uniref:UDP-3-O-acylglucosamine N-acyltransferase n=1 Tax=Candidatus Protochlamydia naegleriophila TaxID=389348 RepID=A0A0U5EQT3_9BACT|nr:UDP-3-O-(3-hydroxymyristoyl)glucosamine N-acyltransferase [Candidatus Protochlamydia naegleriophila]CUI16528.1 UDP-3-O-[3-hydroxymyristoyl] glucosamine N-acyltransferase [Candidatus Protochlamydia naegleriophila]